MMSRFPFEKSGDTIQIAGVILQDAPEGLEYACYLPESTPYDESAIYDNWTAAEWLQWLKSSDDPKSPVFTDESRKVIKAMVRKMARQVDQNIVWATYRRAGFKCEYCGADDLPLTYDHYLAQAYGGETTLENGRAACRPCNKAKGHKTIEEWEDYMRQKGWIP